MTKPDASARSADTGNAPQQRAAELLRSNEALREDARAVREANVELERRLAEAHLGNVTERETRRAALNLMEDAIEARESERRENAERRRVEEELRIADRRKDEFLATLAHELRNPLAPICNSLAVLRLSAGDNEEVDRTHDMLERQVSHLIRLVDDLMEVSRITRGNIELRKEPIDIASIVRSAVESSKPLIDAAQHRLTVSVLDQPMIVDADAVRMVQILTNLLNNAAKYTEAGGQIWLSAHREDDFAVISVRDTGIGIPEAMLPRIFDLFTQVDRTLGRAQGGLGIGLALVRTLVTAHGGTIEGRSDGPGYGSDFVVRMPLAAAALDESPDDRADLASALRTPRGILVVDDNRDAATTLCTLLEHLGAEVHTANSGIAALDAVRTFKPSIVLLDISMPGMDGYEVARRVRMEPGGGDITLIALSGYGRDEDRQRSREAGFDHHLVKPVDFGALATVLALTPRTPLSVPALSAPQRHRTYTRA